MENIWCICVQCPHTGKSKGWEPHEIGKAISFIEGLDVIIGHNLISYDIPLFKKFYPDFKCPAVFDTLILSRMLEPDRLQHGLDSWGKQLGNFKGDYGKQENAWVAYTPEMLEYCKTDVDLNTDLYKYLCKQAGFDSEHPPSFK